MNTVELDFCCPECNCSQWYCIDDADNLYGCARCYYTCTFDFIDEGEEQEQQEQEQQGQEQGTVGTGTRNRNKE